MQWMMLQQENPEDFVIATGHQFSVRQFIEWAADELGLTLAFEGHGDQEAARVVAVKGEKAPAIREGDILLRVDARYYRPTEVETLLGDPTRARERLGWVPQITAREMCAEMVARDLGQARQQALLAQHGY